mmetsp:Transcript_5742/g.13060  ORF Transcript_5742/g.13060 Transcript_5742/m.13060 type:complete len:299 (+) Transcript_5742:1556-2452(+)
MISLVFLVGHIPSLFGFIMCVLHTLLLSLVPCELCLQCLHLVFSRFNRSRPIDSNSLLHCTVISHHDQVAAPTALPVITTGQEEHFTNLSPFDETLAIIFLHEEGLFTAFLGIRQCDRVNADLIDQKVECHGILHIKYTRDSLHSWRWGRNVILLFRGFGTDAIQWTIARTASHITSEFVHQLQIFMVRDDESFEGSSTNGGLGEFGVVFLAVDDLDIHANWACNGSLELVGLGCLLDGLIQTFAFAPKHRQRRTPTPTATLVLHGLQLILHSPHLSVSSLPCFLHLIHGWFEMIVLT